MPRNDPAPSQGIYTFGLLAKRQRSGNADKCDRVDRDRLPDFLEAPAEAGAPLNLNLR